jgi:sigma-B regulation protein RsbU (phosphoserine phosphatase)
MNSEQLLGNTSLDPGWAAVTPDMQPLDGNEHPAMRALATGRPVQGFVMGVRTGTSTYRWLRIDSWPIDLSAGESGVLTQFDDITTEIETRADIDRALDRLQRNVVPSARVDIAGLDVHTRYRNVTAPLQIGGDFCDVYPTREGRHAFFIGDACGHDLDTVTTTLVAHYTLRAAGLHLTRPGRVLAWLDDTIKATPDCVHCSAVHGTIDTTESGIVSIKFANAGHPRPIHISQGTATPLELAGALTGALEKFTEPPTVDVELEPGDELVFYTDGLTDSPVPRIDDAQFIASLEHGATEGRNAIAVIDEMLQRADSSARRDDTAVLVLQRPR